MLRASERTAFTVALSDKEMKRCFIVLTGMSAEEFSIGQGGRYYGGYCRCGQYPERTKQSFIVIGERFGTTSDDPINHRTI